MRTGSLDELLPGRAEVRRIVQSGLAAGLAYAAAMAVDLRLVGNKVDDFAFLGRPFVGGHRNWARPAGVAIHAANSVNLAVPYALVAADRLPGPPWLRGVLYANVENALLYPLTALTDRVHPGVRDGQIDRYWTWPAFWQSVGRHVAYGAVLGTVLDRSRRGRAG